MSGVVKRINGLETKRCDSGCDAVYANRRRIRGARGRRLQRRRSEYLERPNAHLYETGGMRRTHLRGHANILKRLLVHVGGFNLGLLMRTRLRRGTPRSVQGQLAVLIGVVVVLWGAPPRPLEPTRHAVRRSRGHVHPVSPSRTVTRRGVSMRSLTTGC